MSEQTIEYANGKPCLLLWRDSQNSLTDVCPFCGVRHLHGLFDGHRVAHCVSEDHGKTDMVISINGVTLCAANGYFLRTRTEATK